LADIVGDGSSEEKNAYSYLYVCGAIQATWNSARTRSNSATKSIKDHSTSPNFPLYILNANFLASLLIIVKPLPVSQVDGRELATRVDAGCKPLTLPKNPTCQVYKLPKE
jgi:hypothetical protein